MKKRGLILCFAAFLTLCSGVDRAFAELITRSNFGVAGFYSVSDFVVDDNGNRIDESQYSESFISHVAVRYVNSLLEWSDSVFRQDTTGSESEAAQIYVIANQYLVVERASWEWMKSYRVWEADRTVFLYPENFIQPEGGDNTSPFLILGTRPEFVPEVSDINAVFFDNLRNTWYTQMSGAHVSVPEPSSLLLLGTALTGLFVSRKFLRKYSGGHTRNYPS